MPSSWRYPVISVVWVEVKRSGLQQIKFNAVTAEGHYDKSSSRKSADKADFKPIWWKRIEMPGTGSSLATSGFAGSGGCTSCFRLGGRIPNDSAMGNGEKRKKILGLIFRLRVTTGEVWCELESAEWKKKSEQTGRKVKALDVKTERTRQEIKNQSQLLRFKKELSLSLFEMVRTSILFLSPTHQLSILLFI